MSYAKIGVYMLNQAQGDSQILAKQLGISPHQLSYVTHSNAGERLYCEGGLRRIFFLTQ